ncbi:hypothetical protein ASNO1_73960 [Corallococcus caeni]|uniref:Uncharacterized protein n=1 Tax=Corallococcus caeni TaxID=3082388 RepID=A0ABQ6R4E4_9BACT|nr:hypothetical protein ASNO1_73960 [Corallococcus sp. NO1]
MALGVGEQRQPGHGLVRTADDALQEHAQVLRHARHRGRGEEVGVVLEEALEARFRLQHLEQQVELRRVRVQLQRLQLHALHGGRAAQGRLEREHHLEERRAPLGALRTQLLHQPLEGDLLVLMGREYRLAHLAQQRAEGRGGLHLRAQHHRVDEQADEALHLAALPARHRRAHRHVLLPRVARQQHLPARQQHHEERGALLLRQRLQRLRQLPRQQQVMTGAPATAGRGAGPVRGQLQRGGHPGQLLLPVVELLLQPRAPQPLALPDAEVGVLHAQGRQGRGLASGEGAVEQRHLAHQQRHGPAVGDDVVHHHREQVLSRRPRQEQRAQERTLREVEGPGRGFTRQPPRRVRRADRVVVLQREHRLRRHDLHGLPGGVLAEGGAEHFVTAHHLAQRALQHVHVQRALHAHRHGHVVERGAGLQLIHEPQALLGERQRQRVRAVLHRDALHDVARGGLLRGHLLEQLGALLR